MRRLIILEAMLALSLAVSVREYGVRGRRLEEYDFREHVKPTKGEHEWSDLRRVYVAEGVYSPEIVVFPKRDFFEVSTVRGIRVLISDKPPFEFLNPYLMRRDGWEVFPKVYRLGDDYLARGKNLFDGSYGWVNREFRVLWKFHYGQGRDFYPLTLTSLGGGFSTFIITRYNAEPSLKNRMPFRNALLLYDLLNEEELWQVDVPYGVLSVVSGDVDRDYLDEHMPVFQSGENGFCCSGATCSGRVQFWIMDRYGNVLYRKTYWGLFSDVTPYLGDYDADGHPEILIVHTYRYTKDGGALEILDPDGWMVRSRYEMEKETPASVLMDDIDDDGNEEILVGGRKGSLFVFDFELNLLKVKDFNLEITGDWDKIDVIPIQSVDFNGDERKEILVELLLEKFSYRSPRGSKRKSKYWLELLDDSLNVIKKFEDQIKGAIVDLDGDGVNELVTVGTKDVEVWKFHRSHP
ncbi:MAG: hypothetical protein DRO93_12690 [Candidatus Thorarchaeota archaeon]|nr:MAG: hypothetical protein DRO93_12690 [Candidatus Thorarchaeota archaeon]